MKYEFEHSRPLNYSTVDQIEILEPRGPWITKSGSLLFVLAALPIEVVGNYFRYDPNELAKMPRGFDIRGFRLYSNRGMPIGNKGGGEFHRIRQEIIIGLEGETFWECEDLNCAKRTFTLTQHIGIKLSPFIMHSYEVKQDNSGILVLANTLFIPDDPRTRDTYSREIFTALQSNG